MPINPCKALGREANIISTYSLLEKRKEAVNTGVSPTRM